MNTIEKTNQLIDIIDPTKQRCLDCREYKDKNLFKDKYFCNCCPTQPFQITPKKMSKEEIEQLVMKWHLVRKSIRASVGYSVGYSVWASVWDSVWASVWDSVWASVRNSVGASVWNSVGHSVWNSVGASVRNSVGASVRNSVGDSVYAYIGSMFPEIKKWKGTNLENPWDPVRKLWKAGYVTSFDGKIWRVHCGAKAEVLYTFNFQNTRG